MGAWDGCAEKQHYGRLINVSNKAKGGGPNSYVRLEAAYDPHDVTCHITRALSSHFLYLALSHSLVRRQSNSAIPQIPRLIFLVFRISCLFPPHCTRSPFACARCRRSICVYENLNQFIRSEYELDVGSVCVLLRPCVVVP